MDRSREMVCYTARVIYPLLGRTDVDFKDEAKFNHLVKYFTRSRIYPVQSTNAAEKWYDIVLSDNNICDFLSYLRAPFYIDYIDYKYPPHSRLYTNNRIKNYTQIYTRSEVENHIYWKAIYTERNMW